MKLFILKFHHPSLKKFSQNSENINHSKIKMRLFYKYDKKQ